MHISQVVALAQRACRLLVSAGAVAAAMSTQSLADPVYIAQIATGLVKDVVSTSVTPSGGGTTTWHSARGQSFTPPPEAVTSTKQNLAQTYQIGSYNSAFHLQSGLNNSSAVGMIGVDNNVAVLQSGNNLKSNVVLLGTAGLNVDVLQPKGSAPVNLLVARLPGGGLLIKR